MKKRKRKKLTDPNGITLGMVSVTFMIVGIALILSMIKIYFSNEIYKESKKVNKIEQEVEALNVENIMLKQNIEALKFKNRVEDTIFIIDNMEEE